MRPSPRLRLYPDPAFRGGIDLQPLERPPQPLREDARVGPERHAAVDQDAEIRPAVEHVAYGPALELPGAGDALEQDEHPRRHAGEEADVLLGGLPPDRLDPGLPVGDGRRSSGRVAAPEEGREPPHRQPREVPHEPPLAHAMEGRAAAEEQHGPAQQGLRAHALHREEQGVPAAPAMRGQRLAGDGDELVAGGGAGGLDPVPHLPRPCHVTHAPHRALPERLKGAVVAQRHPLLVLRHRADPREPVRQPELGVARRRDQLEQALLLHAGRPAPRPLERAAPPRRPPAQGPARRPCHHRAAPATSTDGPRRSRVARSHHATAAANRSGHSSIGAWPQAEM